MTQKQNNRNIYYNAVKLVNLFKHLSENQLWHLLQFYLNYNFNLKDGHEFARDRLNKWRQKGELQSEIITLPIQYSEQDPHFLDSWYYKNTQKYKQKDIGFRVRQLYLTQKGLENRIENPAKDSYRTRPYTNSYAIRHDMLLLNPILISLVCDYSKITELPLDSIELMNEHDFEAAKIMVEINGKRKKMKPDAKIKLGDWEAFIEADTGTESFIPKVIPKLKAYKYYWNTYKDYTPLIFVTKHVGDKELRIRRIIEHYKNSDCPLKDRYNDLIYFITMNNIRKSYDTKVKNYENHKNPLPEYNLFKKHIAYDMNFTNVLLPR